ncbi:MAG TPA: hypothetical protein VMG10_34120 [Gemmataceae bacterium]|nr:hypothetical protein [Gemmataceae bacterium]
MQISTPSSQEIAAKERVEIACSLRCPVCSGSLIPLHNAYRCSRCCYHLCAGCEQPEVELPGGA